MKWSNSALALVAVLSIVLSSYVVMIPAATTTPTSVISVVPEVDGKLTETKGAGFSMILPKFLSSKQVQLLRMAYDIAKGDGHKQPQVLQGILLQETKAGDMASYKVAGQEFGLKTNERYYGVTQIKLSAAKDVLKQYPELKKEYGFSTNTDEEIIAKLIENDRFNLAVASKYLLVLKAAGFDTIQELSLAYNQGAGGAKAHDANTFGYSVGVMKNIQSLRLNKNG